ncbi:uncharacterized protein LOC144175991 isoform X5 [Haemaphysalis longicornis]
MVADALSSCGLVTEQISGTSKASKVTRSPRACPRSVTSTRRQRNIWRRTLASSRRGLGPLFVLSSPSARRTTSKPTEGFPR